MHSEKLDGFDVCVWGGGGGGLQSKKITSIFFKRKGQSVMYILMFILLSLQISKAQM